MSSCGTASHPLWGRSSENGCISNSEKETLNSSCPMPTGEDGHTGGNAAGVCPTGTKPPSSCSRHTRAFGGRMVWKCGNDGFDFQSVRLGGIEPEFYSVYQAAKAIAVGCCNITLADLASPELVTDEAFHLITGALLMAKYGDAVLNSEKGVDET